MIRGDQLVALAGRYSVPEFSTGADTSQPAG